MSWQSILESVPNPDRGKVGIEVEFALRHDVLEDFQRLIQQYSFSQTDDCTIRLHSYSLEKFYCSTEIKNSQPEKLSVLLPKLSRILAWLKREDKVSVRNGHLQGKESSNWGWSKSRTIQLPRGITPRSMTTGTHIHFDLKGWFDDAAHLQRFTNFFNRSSRELKGQVIPQRYNKPTSGSRGDDHAKFISYDYPRPESGEKFVKWMNRMKASSHSYRERAANISNPERGDVEIRMFHGTLNMETIIHWLKLIMEMIEATGDDNPSALQGGWSDFKRGVDDQTGSELLKRDAKYRKSTWNPDDRKKPSRHVSRILGET